MSDYWPSKDPDEKLDYLIDWAPRLNGDTISTSTVSAPGLTLHSTAATQSAVTIWLSGGTAGTRHLVHNRIVTSGGRTMDKTVPLWVLSK